METYEDRDYQKEQIRAVQEYERMMKDKKLANHGAVLPVSPKKGTEHCHLGSSRLHRLACGHIIHTEKESMCASNCSTPISTFAPFVCIICERWNMVQSGKASRRSSRFTELILPDFPVLDHSQVPIIGRARECNAVYMLPKGHVLVLHSMQDIALARIEDELRVRHILNEIVEATEGMGCSAPFIESITRGVTSCIEHQHLWTTASYEELAAVNMYVAALRANTDEPGMLPRLAACFGADRVKVRKLVADITKLLVDLDARATIAKFMPTFEKIFPKLWRKYKVFARLVLKLWNKVKEREPFPPDFVLENWLRIVASCIDVVMLANDINIPVHKTCAAVGANEHGDVGEDIDMEITLLMGDDKAYSFRVKSTQSYHQRKLKARKVTAPQGK
ncbi:uncharacterized protein K460DRAFT_394649 [Cucurbitaria berberidis CBS 394.84]|uniref:Uncharacterized protein n=1 Tax=Cucurbitaria berberidis CBS 394.84 TaxID=1168544 RepID=A0A9P4L803_9PLEO|nr:uncharacterized protein K460DRAFT_394649 [Cucurbitaria berberidis CBS 394.84]KAF1844852.1 hypothetical protein K460DRAFT_394649 [Cucurbitaria berberidis CBS 394.84]